MVEVKINRKFKSLREESTKKELWKKIVHTGVVENKREALNMTRTKWKKCRNKNTHLIERVFRILFIIIKTKFVDSSCM